MKHQPLITIGAFLLFCFFNLQSIEGQVDPDSKEFITSIDSIFADKADMTGPGASIIIIKGSSVILSKNYGSANLSFGVPFNENTLFPLPNFTDHLVAFSVLQLDQKGLIKLTDPINKYLPEFGFQNDVLITHLLNHSSDLPFLLSLRLMAGWNFTDPFYQNDFLNLTKKFTKDLKPDNKIIHSHTGIKILQMLVEKVSQKNFSEYASLNIFQPLGMTSSVIKNEYFKEHKNNSIGYNETDVGYQRSYSTELALMCPMAYSTQNDFGKWMLNVQTKNFEGSIIEQMDQALLIKGEPQKRLNGTYCIGQQQYYKFLGEDEFYLMESYEGHSWKWIRLQESDLSIMAIGNLSSYIGNKVNAVARLLVPPISKSSTTEKTESTPIILSEKEMEACTGVYWNEDYLYTTEISIKDGVLYHSDNDNGFNFVMSPQTNTFFETPFGGTIEFTSIGGNQKKMRNILPNGRVFDSKEYDVAALKKGNQLKYVGLYSSDKLNAFYSIVWEDQQLILRRSRKPDLVLTPIGDNRFRVSEIDFRLIEFEENEKGDVLKMKISNNGVKNVEFRKL